MKGDMYKVASIKEARESATVSESLFKETRKQISLLPVADLGGTMEAHPLSVHFFTIMQFCGCHPSGNSWIRD